MSGERRDDEIVGFVWFVAVIAVGMLVVFGGIIVAAQLIEWLVTGSAVQRVG